MDIQSKNDMDYQSLMLGDWVRMKIPSGTRWFTDKVRCLTPYGELEYQAIPLTKIPQESPRALAVGVCQMTLFETEGEFIEAYDTLERPNVSYVTGSGNDTHVIHNPFNFAPRRG